MATVPVRQTSDGHPTETLEERFRRLEAIWIAEVGHLSSPSVLMTHPAFQEILCMGEVVVPLMLRDLEERPRLWVWALPEIRRRLKITWTIGMISASLVIYEHCTPDRSRSEQI